MTAEAEVKPARGADESGRAESAAAAPVELYRMAIGHYLSRALALAAKLGVADLMKDGPRDCGELARGTGTNEAALRRVMRLLASAGVFVEQGERFALTPLSRYLRTDVAGSMRASVMLFAGLGIQDAWKELEYCVKTGEPAFRKTSPGGDPFSAIKSNPEQAKVFDEAMAAFAPVTAAAIAAAYDFSGFRRIVDVGGGNGALLIGILKANPRLAGIVFDLPHNAESARSKIAAAGLGARCDAVGGDFFHQVPPGADAYVIKHVIHDWNDERAGAILRNVSRAMAPAGKLLIAEGLYPERIEATEECRGAAGNDVNMLVSTGGRQRSAAEFRELFSAAGFRLTRIIPTQARLSVIEAVRV